MSLLDELMKEASTYNEVDHKRVQIEALRAQAQEAVKTQFFLEVASDERIAFLQGRIAAFDDCLQLFHNTDEEQPQPEEPEWDDAA